MNEGSTRWSPKKKSTQTRQTEQEEEEKEKKKEREQIIQKEKKMSTNNHLTETIKDTDVIMTDTNTDKSEDVAKDDVKGDVKDDVKDDVTATAAEEDNKVQSVIDEDGDVIMKRTTDSSNQITSSIPVSLPNATSNTTNTTNNNNNTTTTNTTSSSSSSSISASINNSSITEAAKETEKKEKTEEKKEKKEKEEKELIKMITVGSIVFVASGTRKNKYRSGGVARVVALNKSQNTPDGSTQIAYNVAYILGGGENYLASRHVSLHHDDSSSTNTSSSSSTSSSSLRSSSRELRTRKEKIAIPGTTSLPPSSPINEQLLNSTNNLYHRKVKYMSNTEWWVGDRCEAKWMADDSDEFPDW